MGPIKDLPGLLPGSGLPESEWEILKIWKMNYYRHEGFNREQYHNNELLIPPKFIPT